jgi:hypothetical protein
MSNGPGASADYSALVGTIGEEIARIHQLTEQKQAFIASGSCEGAVAFLEISTVFGDLRATTQGLAAQMATQLFDSVRGFILARGPTAGVVGGESLAAFVTQQAAGVPLVPFWIVPLGPPAVAGFLAGALPSGVDILNRNRSRWTSEAGLPLSPGVFLTNGKLTGPQVDAWIGAWVGQLSGSGGPSPALFPFARSALVDLVGAYFGSRQVGGWSSLRLWRPSDGPGPDSRLSRLAFLEGDARRVGLELEALCGGTRRLELFGEGAAALIPFAFFATAAFVWGRR